MARLDIEGLDWDDDYEARIARHGVDPETVVDMIEGQDGVEVRNRRTHPNRRRRLIGRDSGGSMVTVILEPTSESGIWRVVTGWWSTRAEATLYAKGRGRHDGSR